MRHTKQEVLTKPDLLQRAQRFEGKALAEIYDTYSQELYNYAYRQLGNPTQAEECVAETYKRLLEALSKRKGPRDHVRAYLYRIAHNWITDQYRRQPLPDLSLEDQMLSDPNPGPHHEIEETQERQQLREALMKLNPNQRLVVALKYLEGWTSPEIAQALDRPLEAVKGLLHRGIENLRHQMKAETSTQEEQ
jgi:RNA polymerase sigma-70 factor (ECF subfamily)